MRNWIRSPSGLSALEGFHKTESFSIRLKQKERNKNDENFSVRFKQKERNENDDVKLGQKVLNTIFDWYGKCVK